MRRSISAAAIVLMLTGFANAQHLAGTLSKVGSQYAEAYITPAVDAFGADVNSGLFNTAKVGGILPFGLNLYVGVKAAAAFIPSSEQSFNLSYLDTVAFNESLNGQAFTINVPATFTVQNAPTIFGEKTDGQATFNVRKDTTITRNGFSQTFNLDSSATVGTIPGLLKTTIAPIPIPQIGVGSIMGTDIFVRFLPKIKLGNYGSFQLLGYGLRHSISQYIPLCPVDIAVQVGWQNLSIQDSTGSKVLKASAFAANLEVSKTLGVLTIYGGLQTESSSVDVNYNYLPKPTPIDPNPQSIPISFSLKGKNTFRELIGLNLGLGVISINADYNIGQINVASAGIGITI